MDRRMRLDVFYRFLVVIVGSIVLNSSVFSQPTVSSRAKLEAVQKELPARWRVEWASDGETIRRFWRQEKGARSRESVEDVVRHVKSLMGIGRNGDAIELAETRRTPGGSHYHYHHLFEGIPIYDSGVKFHADRHGFVYQAEKYGLTLKAKPSGTVWLGASTAIDIATRHRPVNRLLVAPKVERVIFADGKRVRHAWKINLPSIEPRGDFEILVDAADGALLASKDLLKRLEGQGRVFDPNPIVISGDFSLRDQDDHADAVPESVYSDVTLLNLDTTGSLQGSFVTVVDSVHEPLYDFRFNRSEYGFEQVMAYYHLNRTCQFIVDLGFGNILSTRKVFVDAYGPTDDQSYYYPSTGRIEYGTGGVDDAEDADVINHEFGHYLQDMQIRGFGTTVESGSIGEGFCDFWAIAQRQTDRYLPYFAMWDATYYSLSEPPALRRLDTNKRYPQDLSHEVHDDGEIWSAVLFRILNELGRNAACSIVLESQETYTNSTGFMDAAAALYTAAHNLYEGVYDAVVLAALSAHGLDGDFRAAGNRVVLSGEEVVLETQGGLIGREFTVVWKQVRGQPVAVRNLSEGSIQFTAPALTGSSEMLIFEASAILADGTVAKKDISLVQVVESGYLKTAEPKLTLPDGGESPMKFSTITIDETQPITGIGVLVDVKHEYAGDLFVQLKSPSGRIVTLKSSSASDSSKDLLQFYLASFDIPSSAALLPFLLENPSGVWRLEVSDVQQGDMGVFERWGLMIETGNKAGFVTKDDLVPIPDEGVATTSITLDMPGSVYEAQVYVDIEHSWIGDLVIDLIAPDGSSINLFNRHGGSADHWSAVYHPNAMLSHQLPALQNLVGTTAAGTWTLKAADRATGDSGEILHWGLKITTEPTDIASWQLY